MVLFPAVNKRHVTSQSRWFHVGRIVGGGTPTTPVLADIPAGTVINLEVRRADAGGMFGAQSKRNFRDCIDGTSNTLMLSEGIIRGASGSTWGELGGYWGGAQPWQPPRRRCAQGMVIRPDNRWRWAATAVR